MEQISVFDMFKIGVGPSSSHTMGPWRAAQDVMKTCQARKIANICVELFGSLSKTGKGHGTDLAIVMGLAGHDPVTVDTDAIHFYYKKILVEKRLCVDGRYEVDFDPNDDIKFRNTFLKQHPNAVRFIIKFEDKSKLVETYYSIGGGFVTREGEERSDPSRRFLHPISTEVELLNWLEEKNCDIADLVMINECCLRSEKEVRSGLLDIWKVMLECIYRGCHSEGILPGGLQVQRRSFYLNRKLLGSEAELSLDAWWMAVKKSERDFETISSWISCFALAVNEENASFGRVVTAPTNGAAGVIPAVLMYYLSFCDNRREEDIIRFLLTSGEIGSLFKKGSTISAAMGGCQAEIGVSSSMAAAGLTACQGGSPRQVLMAAEIAMEHHLGLTCDPVMGLVQVPCIERNTMGAIKAITASQLALSGDYTSTKVNLDQIIKTMWETAKDMHSKYKETSEGGLAQHIDAMLPEC